MEQAYICVEGYSDTNYAFIGPMARNFSFLSIVIPTVKWKEDSVKQDCIRPELLTWFTSPMPIQNEAVCWCKHSSHVNWTLNSLSKGKIYGFLLVVGLLFFLISIFDCIIIIHIHGVQYDVSLHVYIVWWLKIMRVSIILSIYYFFVVRTFKILSSTCFVKKRYIIVNHAHTTVR